MNEEGGWLYLESADLLRIVDDWQLQAARDESMLEAACARPRTSVGGVEPYADVAAKAAALGHSATDLDELTEFLRSRMTLAPPP